MSEDKKDLKLEKELLACGFTRKDVKILFNSTEGYYPVEVIKRIKLISYTTLFVIVLSIISMVGMIVTDYYQNRSLLDSFFTAFLSILIVNIVVNFIFPFKIGLKCSLFLIKKKIN